MRAHKTNWKMRRTWRLHVANVQIFDNPAFRVVVRKRQELRKLMTKGMVFAIERGLTVHPVVRKLAK